MVSRDNQVSLVGLMIAIAVLAVALAVFLALRDGPMVGDPPYVPRARPRRPLRRPILIAGLHHRPSWTVHDAIGRDVSGEDK
jgi:hypothetical protein